MTSRDYEISPKVSVSGKNSGLTKTKNTEQKMNHAVIPQELAVEAMRSSAFRNTAQALAELIDNSIQAGLGVNKKTTVEILAIDTLEQASHRRSRRIKEIAVYDNASGMNAQTLRMALQFGNGTNLETKNQKGIGKFGMGLPNSSISRCRHVDVWTWVDGKCLYSYLDIDEIVQGDLVDVPEPKESQIPNHWKKLIRDEICDHGTLVVWSKFDRLRETRSQPLLKNAEAQVGRTYRYYLNNGTALIRLVAFTQEGKAYENTFDQDARPNDPLGLMNNTICPEPWATEVPFVKFGDTVEVTVHFQDKDHLVEIDFSHCKPEPRKEGGSSPIGKWAMANQGVSVVRADRELELNNTWDVTYDPVERWWGAEVRFGPALDELFGVTHDKQSAKDFYKCSLKDDADSEALSESEYKKQLEADQDPRTALYKISTHIDSALSTIRDQVKRMREGTRRAIQGKDASTSEDIATRATEKRKEEQGLEGESDKQQKEQSDDERIKQLTDELVDVGLPQDDAGGMAVKYVKDNIKFLFEKIDFPGASIFDVKSIAGTIIIRLNTRHPASEKLYEILQPDSEDDSSETPALTGLKLLLSAWARMEDEANEKQRVQYEDTRLSWGTIARQFLDADD
jgi:hypothetical protein